MVIDYGKKDVVPLSEHFDSVAFNCPCNDPGCNHTLVDSDLVEDLEKLYALVGEIWASAASGTTAWSAASRGASTLSERRQTSSPQR